MDARTAEGQWFRYRLSVRMKSKSPYVFYDILQITNNAYSSSLAVKHSFRM